MQLVHYISGLAAVVCLVSCNSVETEGLPSVKMVPKTFTATELLSKTELDGLKVRWTAGDVIKIAGAASIGDAATGSQEALISDNQLFPFTTAEGGDNAVFTGELPESFGPSGIALYSPDLVQIYYKASSTPSSRRFSPRMIVPNVQTGIKGGVASNTLFLYAGKSYDLNDIDFENGKISFRFGCALIRVSVAGNDVKQIVLSADQFLASTRLNYNILSGACSVLGEAYNGITYNSISLVPEIGRSTFEPGDYYFSVITNSNADNKRDLSGLKVSYVKKDDSIWSKTSPNTLHSFAGKVYDFHIDETGCTEESVVGNPLPAWSEGCLDIHFINTTSGECSFIIFPDGTQMLVDAAGARTRTGSGSVTNVEIRSRWDPLASGNDFNYGAFIARYIDKCMAWTHNPKLDYALLTHFHNDHFGGRADMPVSTLSPSYYQQSFPYLLDRYGATRLIDRAWPDYDYPIDLRNDQVNTSNAGNVNNYVAAVNWHVNNKGMVAEKFIPGSASQICLQSNPSAYPGFSVRNLAANGEVWTGSGDNTEKRFPDKAQITGDGSKSSDFCPNENATSIAFRLSYGKFDYFAGGDMSYVGVSTYSWKDIETPVAKVCEEVEVMKADHHGCSSTNGVEPAKGAVAMSYLKPQCWIVNTWADTQPATAVLSGVSSTLPSADIYITNLAPSVLDAVSASVKSAIKGYNGHVVVRVNKGGDSYNVYTLSDSDQSMTVQTINGPYKCE